MQNYKMIEDLKIIFNHFGPEVQKKKLQEECHEYIKDMNEKEAADILIVAMQLYIFSPKMRKAVDYKIRRTIDRIKEDYYDKETGRKKAWTNKLFM